MDCVLNLYYFCICFCFKRCILINIILSCGFIKQRNTGPPLPTKGEVEEVAAAAFLLFLFCFFVIK